MPTSVSLLKERAGAAAEPSCARRGSVAVMLLTPMSSLFRPVVAKPNWSSLMRYKPESGSPEKETAGAAAVPFCPRRGSVAVMLLAAMSNLLSPPTEKPSWSAPS